MDQDGMCGIVRSAQIADILEVEPSRFIDRLDMGCERKKK